MLELKFNAPELREYVKSIPKIKGQLFDLMRLNVKEVAADFINGVMETEFSLFIGREKHQRHSLVSITEKNYRNGHTKSMEIVAGEQSCYNLLAVISLRMEIYWQRHPITFQKALPWFKSRDEFTQDY